MSSDRRYSSLGHWHGGSDINIQNGDYTLVANDAGKTISKESGGAGETITIPAATSVNFDIGTMVAIQNDGGGDLSIAITSDTLENTNGVTGTQTLSDHDVAVIQKVTATKWRYSGTSVASAVEGTAVLSTGETGGTKFLREDGDGTCSWQAASGGSGVTASPGVFQATGSTNITSSAATLGLNTEVLDPDTNYALSSSEITVTAAGYYFVSINVPVADDSTSGDTTTSVRLVLQQDQTTSTWIDVEAIRAWDYAREGVTGSGVNASGIVQLSASEVIRARIVQSNNTDISTESAKASLSIHKIRDT